MFVSEGIKESLTNPFPPRLTRTVRGGGGTRGNLRTLSVASQTPVGKGIGKNVGIVKGDSSFPARGGDGNNIFSKADSGERDYHRLPIAPINVS